MSSLQLLVVIIGCGDAGSARIDESASSARVAHDHRRLWYRDADGDGFGDPEQSHRAFTRPPGFAVKAGDCDDAHAAAHPGATEAPTSGLDDDCDGETAATRVDELPVWDLTGAHEAAYLGIDLTTTDVTGDGMTDLVLGAHRTYLDGVPTYGSVTIFDGPLDPLGTPDESDASAVLYADEYSNYSNVCSVGDLDADGVNDLVVGRYSEGDAEGAAYVARGPLDGLIDLALDTQAYRGDRGDYLGRCAGPGDVDGDGLPDVVLGAYAAANDRGMAYLLRGPVEQASLEDADQLFMGTHAWEMLGGRLAAVGDLTGDGTGDYAMAGWLNRPAQGMATYVITDYTPGATDPRDVGITVTARGSYNPYAFVPNRVGDVDGDGYDDLGIGGDTYRYTDKFFIVLGPFGSTSSVNVTTDNDILLRSLPTSNHPLLSFATPLGDWNDDGTGVLAIADPGLMPPWMPDFDRCRGDSESCQWGAVFLLAEPIEPGTHELGTEADRIDGISAHGYLGGTRWSPSLQGGSDLNGDGSPDLAFGAPEAIGTEGGEGHVYVLFGSGSF